MAAEKEPENEIIIKSKKRVQSHGEVFTPKTMVNKMLDMPGIKEACNNLTDTFLEPACGEGAFLTEILKRKLNIIEKNYNNTLEEYENYSLLGLSTLYGIEILEDNAQECVMQMYQVYLKYYSKQTTKHNKREKSNIRKSARFIISRNIVQGDFLTKKLVNGKPIIFNEWKPKEIDKNPKNIIIERTEYTLEDIYNDVKKESGDILSSNSGFKQLSMLDMIDSIDPKEEIQYKYIPTKITNIFKEEMEEDHGKSD